MFIYKKVFKQKLFKTLSIRDGNRSITGFYNCSVLYSKTLSTVSNINIKNFIRWFSILMSKTLIENFGYFSTVWTLIAGYKSSYFYPYGRENIKDFFYVQFISWARASTSELWTFKFLLSQQFSFSLYDWSTFWKF